MWKSAKTAATSATPSPTAPGSVLASGSSLLISPGRTSGSTGAALLGGTGVTPLIGLLRDEMVGDLHALLAEVLHGPRMEGGQRLLQRGLAQVVDQALEGGPLVLLVLDHGLDEPVRHVHRHGLGSREADHHSLGPELAHALDGPRRHPDPRVVRELGLDLADLLVGPGQDADGRAGRDVHGGGVQAEGVAGLGGADEA